MRSWNWAYLKKTCNIICICFISGNNCFMTLTLSKLVPLLCKFTSSYRIYLLFTNSYSSKWSFITSLCFNNLIAFLTIRTFTHPIQWGSGCFCWLSILLYMVFGKPPSSILEVMDHLNQLSHDCTSNRSLNHIFSWPQCHLSYFFSLIELFVWLELL